VNKLIRAKIVEDQLSAIRAPPPSVWAGAERRESPDAPTLVGALGGGSAPRCFLRLVEPSGRSIAQPGRGTVTPRYGA